VVICIPKATQKKEEKYFIGFLKSLSGHILVGEQFSAILLQFDKANKIYGD
jgi:hypothetical protein